MSTTLPVTVIVEFHSGGTVFAQSFPNNAKCSELLDYAAAYLSTPKGGITMKAVASDQIIEPTVRLMELSSCSPFQVCLGLTETSSPDSEQNNDDTSKPIAANMDLISRVPDLLVEKLLKSTQGIADPKKIMETYQNFFCQGRALDVIDKAEYIEGETSQIFVSRNALFTDSMEEMRYIENIRFLLEVNFLGESARDYGGPSKEFFGQILSEIKQNLTTVDDGQIVLKKDDHSLAICRYFYSGMLIGLSAIEGGPFAEYLSSLIDNSQESEEKAQFRYGLNRTGMYELIRNKTSVKYLFAPREGITLNVNKFLHLMEATFSEEGSNRRIKEEAAFRQFVTYLREVFAGRRENITLGKILKFFTGSDEVPLLGYSINPSISFTEGMYPTASTCINALLLPYEVNYDRLDLAFSSDYFGLE